MDGEKNIAAKGKSPSDFAALITSPHSEEAFSRALPVCGCYDTCGEVTSAAKSEGHSPFAITALLKNLPYFFKKSLYGLDFRHLFCYNS